MPEVHVNSTQDAALRADRVPLDRRDPRAPLDAVELGEHFEARPVDVVDVRGLPALRVDRIDGAVRNRAEGLRVVEPLEAVAVVQEVLDGVYARVEVLLPAKGVISLDERAGPNNVRFSPDGSTILLSVAAGPSGIWLVP